MELWTSLVSPAESKDPRAIVERARTLERDGWSGAVFPDSQVISPEAFAILSWCASVTTHLKVGTGTSNPATRHPSVIASAAAAIQVLSSGRFTLSIGRGDSSLAYLGVPPVPMKFFETGLATIQSYLRGEPVSMPIAAKFLGELDRGVAELSVASIPETSTMSWMPDDYVKPELEATASGPKSIAIAARYVDRISFALGADTERLKWGIRTAREEAERSGRDPETLSFGAYVPCYPHEDAEVARDLARGMVASMSRFSAMHKKASGPMTERDRANVERVAATYNMKAHGASSSDQAQGLDPEFIDNFALVGPAQGCIDRVGEIEKLGIDRLVLWTGGMQGRAGESYRVTVDELLPAVLGSRSGAAL
ncbi:LLM class flavin-dependent oxidoreductase [Pseudarthrobacter siccitolerans]